MRALLKSVLVMYTVLVVIILTFFALFFLNQDFQEFLISLTRKEETVYAKGYSIDNWKDVRKHDTLEKVIKILGEPLKKSQDKDGLIHYYYSMAGPRNTNYRVRIIIFNSEGKVIEKIKEFYID